MDKEGHLSCPSHEDQPIPGMYVQPIPGMYVHRFIHSLALQGS